MEGEVTEEGTRAEIKRVVHHVQQENKMLQISSLDQQPEANHWIGNVTTTLTSLLSSSLTFNKPESPRTTPADSVLVLPERHHEVHI